MQRDIICFNSCCKKNKEQFWLRKLNYFREDDRTRFFFSPTPEVFTINNNNNAKNFIHLWLVKKVFSGLCEWVCACVCVCCKVYSVTVCLKCCCKQKHQVILE